MVLLEPFMLFWSSSAWTFVPFSNTDRVRINLKQTVRFDRLIPIFVKWFVVFIAGAAISFLIVFSSALLSALIYYPVHLHHEAKFQQDVKEANFRAADDTWTTFIQKMHASRMQRQMNANKDNEPTWVKFMTFSSEYIAKIGSISLLIYLVFWIFANLKVYKEFYLAKEWYRSSISVDYGFPKKYRLMTGISDAPISTQMEGVFALCDAIKSADFSVTTAKMSYLGWAFNTAKDPEPIPPSHLIFDKP